MVEGCDGGNCSPLGNQEAGKKGKSQEGARVWNEMQLSKAHVRSLSSLAKPHLWAAHGAVNNSVDKHTDGIKTLIVQLPFHIPHLDAAAPGIKTSTRQCFVDMTYVNHNTYPAAMKARLQTFPSEGRVSCHQIHSKNNISKSSLARRKIILKGSLVLQE